MALGYVVNAIYLVMVLCACTGLDNAFGDTTAAAKSNPYKTLGACYPKAAVKLASKVCANGWSRPRYPSWGDSNEDDIDAAKKVEQPTRIKAGKDNSFTVLDVNQDTRMVQIEASGEKLWVDADALDCDKNRNVSMYKLPPPTPDDGRCPKVDIMVNINYLFQTTVSDSQAELGLNLDKKAEEYHEALKANVANDNKVLIDAFRDHAKSDQERYDILNSSLPKIQELYQRATKIYGSDCTNSAFPPQTLEIPRERGQRECRTLVRTYKMIAKLMEMPDHKKALNAFESEMTGAQIAAEPNNDQIAVRMLIYYGMGLEKPLFGLKPPYFQLKASLKLVNHQSSDLTVMEGTLGKRQGPAFDELMNGYLYAQSGTPGSSIECAAFAMNYLLGMRRVADPNQGKGSLPSVPDFENIHRAKSGEGPKELAYFDEYKNCFDMVDLRKDERPVPGDFVSSHGHVVIVKNYNPLSRTIETVEAASGKCGSVCNQTRPLYEPVCEGAPGEKSDEWELRPLRADLRMMRYSPKPGCPVPANVPRPLARRS